MTEHVIEVFDINEAVMTYRIYAGKNKDYYLSVETKHRGQTHLLHTKVLIGDDYEENAREKLRQNDMSNPSPKTLAKQIGDMFMKDFKEIC